MKSPSLNVYGQPLATCGTKPMTGAFRNGCCDTGPLDLGTHTVCAIVTADFLAFSKSRGNDLTKPLPKYNFPGLAPGDRWCLCVSRWKEAYLAGVAPPIDLNATHLKTLEVVDIDALERFSISK